MKRKMMLVLFVVAALVVLAVVPAMASSGFGGAHEIVVKSAEESMRVLFTTAPAGSAQNSPTFPMDHYTCYYEGIRIPCRMISWLWW